jgi:hypothetical protein
LTCRVHVTPDGLAGSPTPQQLREVITQPQGVRGPTVPQDDPRG